MGQNIYTNYWNSVLPSVIEEMQQGVQLVKRQVANLKNYGKRDSYDANFKIINGNLETPAAARAFGRDFFSAFTSTDYFRDNLFNSRLQINIRNFILKIEILNWGVPDFFTDDDFVAINKFAGVYKVAGNTDHNEVYNHLKASYQKVEYWASQMQKQLFPFGNISLRKRPTNQANNFEHYQWAKIFPDKISSEANLIAFTVSFDTDYQFVVKIDTVVGLNESDWRRKKYLELRGDYYHSPFVKIFSAEEILKEGWQNLLAKSKTALQTLTAPFNNLLKEISGKGLSFLMLKPENMPALNTILYGPPGTGKTYHTITKAAEIITGECFKDRYSDAKTVYKESLAKGQIEFVTFHQNYSYEDFVAGLRPNTDDANQLSFKEHKGVFYRISDEARKNWEQHTTKQTYTEPTFEEVLEEFLQPLIEDEEIEIATVARNVSFHITGNNAGVNLSFRKKSGGTGHTLSIATLKEMYEKKKQNQGKGLDIYYWPVVDKLNTLAASMRIETGEVKLKNFVLIIDEINRANISRVFGELVTLLEPDKRLGADNELTLRLPGLPDDERFGVPPNLYIVGTMNTADKSIALIDIALRRRFVFEDMYPRKEIVSEIVPEQYRAFLLALNEAIRKQKSADFMIGHAYFIPEKDKELNILQVLNQKVIPLLNEYFYNQRNNPVWSLLSPLQNTLAGVKFEQDDFIGVKAIAQ